MRERLLGHYRLTVAQMEALDYGAALEMYEAATMTELRAAAFMYSAQGGGVPWEIIPEAFPESGVSKRNKALDDQTALDDAVQHALERIMRDNGITLRQAQERAKWYHGPLAAA